MTNKRFAVYSKDKEKKKYNKNTQVNRKRKQKNGMKGGEENENLSMSQEISAFSTMTSSPLNGRVKKSCFVFQIWK